MSKKGEGREDIAAYLLRMRARGISDRRLLAAIEATPREDFIPGQWIKAAYSSRMIPIDCGESIEGLDLQTRIFATLDVQQNHRILEIGTGSGFTTAVLARLGQRVTTVDRYKTLCANAMQRFEALELNNIITKHMDGSESLPGEGPFDRIVSWVAFEGLPRSYVELLSSGGIMIAPIGPGDSGQSLAKLTKIGSRFEREDIANVRLQPAKPGLAAAL